MITTQEQYIDYTSTQNGVKEHQKEIKEWNKALIARFPWLRPNSLEEDDYCFTYLDDMPIGWYRTFGVQMCEEIQAVLEKYGVVDRYEIVQVKEKYGGLRWYDYPPQECWKEIADITSKYEHMSEYICCECGKPANWISEGWICPYCDDCKEKFEIKGGKFKPMEKN